MSRFVPRLLLILFLCHLCIGAEAFAGQNKAYTRTVEALQVPDVILVNQDGVRVSLRPLLGADQPVLVDFAYTTCTTICPLLSANFANFQKTLSKQSGKTRLVTISLDPEYDSPREMKSYLKRYQAKPGWDFLTGSRQDIDRVLKAFKVYTRNKMDHPPVILLRSSSDNQWVRITGLVGTSDLVAEYEKVRR
jgi:protein SCO1/2